MLWRWTFRRIIIGGVFAVIITYGIIGIVSDSQCGGSSQVKYIRKNYNKDSDRVTRTRTTVKVDAREEIMMGSCPAELSLLNKSVISQTKFKTNMSYPKVLILTPVKNAKNTLKDYFRLLCSLDYPRNLLSVAVGEDSSTDNTQQVARRFVDILQGYFHRVEFHKLDLNEFHLPVGVVDRHSYKWQLPRRRQLAKVRNQLLHRALRDEDFVLWLDSDLKYYNPDLIKRLLATNKDIVTASCMTQDSPRNFRIYDRNSWRETEASRNFMDGKPPGYLMLEGYHEPTMRIYLPKLEYEGDLVRIDGVGGCALLVRANCHRNGLIFPPFVYKHHIETEGFAKMASEFQCEVYGMPKYYVIHKG